MDIDILKEFITLSEVLNFSKAAQQHYITQPVLSKHIIQLEDELNSTLFYRNRQQVSITDAGKIFAEDAKRIISIYEKSKKKILSMQAQFETSLSLTYLDSVARDYLFYYIPSFIKKYPQCHLELINNRFEELYPSIDTRKADMALTLCFNPSNDPAHQSSLFYKDRLCVVVPETNPLSEKRVLTLEDVCQYKFCINMPEFLPSYELFISHLMAKHDTQNTYHGNHKMFNYVKSVEEGFLLTASGFGVCIVPKSQKYFAYPNLHLIPLSGDDMLVDVSFIWRNDNTNPNIANFIDLIMSNPIEISESIDFDS